MPKRCHTNWSDWAVSTTTLANKTECRNPVGGCTAEEPNSWTLYGTLMGEFYMTVLLLSNGTILGSAKGTIDTGHWTVSGNKICIGWSKELSGSTRCSSLLWAAGYHQGSGFTIKPIWSHIICLNLFEYKAISPMHENSVRSGTRALILNHVHTLFELLH